MFSLVMRTSNAGGFAGSTGPWFPSWKGSTWTLQARDAKCAYPYTNVHPRPRRVQRFSRGFWGCGNLGNFLDIFLMHVTAKYDLSTPQRILTQQSGHGSVVRRIQDRRPQAERSWEWCSDVPWITLLDAERTRHGPKLLSSGICGVKKSRAKESSI